jgi:hypothetical protein
VCAFGIWVSEVVETSGFGRLLEPGCTERPTCRCGKEMEIARIEQQAMQTFASIAVPRVTTRCVLQYGLQ